MWDAQVLVPPPPRPRVPLRIVVRASVKPTEDPEKVKAAIASLFPGARLEAREGEVTASAGDLSRLRELIRSERIPDTARGVMLAGLSMDGSSARFLLGKQAAVAGRVHFGPLRSPLGDLEVSLFGDEEHEVERAIYATAPDTTCDPEWAEVPPALRPAP